MKVMNPEQLKKNKKNKQNCSSCVDTFGAVCHMDFSEELRISVGHA